MRDPNRIDDFLKELGEIWKENVPDWRFGQLFCNLQRREDSDLFFYEDNELIKAIRDMMG